MRLLGADSRNEIVFITQRGDARLPGVRNIVYKPARVPTPNLHHYLLDTEAATLNAQAVARIAIDLRQSGFVPDVMLGHNGWGEIWYLKDVFPHVPLLGYFEFFYTLHGADVGFDPATPASMDSGPRLRSKNIGNLIGLDACDLGQCPTAWQKSLYPSRYQSLLHVIHEGIDTRIVKPDPQAGFRIPGTTIDVAAGDEIVTYVGRNLEPYRGFPQFMRSIPSILSQQPHARILIVGGDEVSYGARLPEGHNYRELLLSELGNSLDLSRVHFLGKVPYALFLKILQVSQVHVYLTYPFVLSWSMLEAMASGCVVVGSKTAPVEEVLRHGENGLLVDFFSPEQISDRVVGVLKEPRAYASMRNNARQTIMHEYDLYTICLPAQLQLLKMLTERGATASSALAS